MKNNCVFVIGLVGQSLFFQVDQFPKIGETIIAKKSFSEIGGKGFNQALAAKRMDAEVCFLSTVGNDQIKDNIREILKKENIHSFLIEKEVKSPHACILTNSQGNNQVIVAKESIQSFQEIDLVPMEEDIKHCKILLLQSEVPTLINQKAIQIATQYDIKVIFNPAPAKKEDLDFCSKVYLFTPNELEATYLFGSNWQEKASEFCIKNKSNILVTQGNKGALLFTTTGKEYFPSINCKAVDSTGAGDAFHGALGAFLAKNYSLRDSIKKAMIVAGLSVQKRGIIGAYPFLNELLEYEKEHETKD